MAQDNKQDTTQGLKPKRQSLFESLFDSQGPGLIRFLSRKLNNTEDARDIAQNAFIRIQHLAESGQLENPKAYLYQTASNLAIDKIRRDQLHHRYLQTEGAWQQDDTGFNLSQSDYCTPERLLAAKQQLEHIEQAISGLPLKCRQAFLLHRVKGRSYSEIADEMSVSVSSVEKYILQALKVCRKALKASGGELNEY